MDCGIGAVDIRVLGLGVDYMWWISGLGFKDFRGGFKGSGFQRVDFRGCTL